MYAPNVAAIVGAMSSTRATISRSLLRIDGWFMAERRERARKARLQSNTGGICPKRNAAGATRRPPEAVRVYVQQATRRVLAGAGFAA